MVALRSVAETFAGQGRQCAATLLSRDHVALPQVSSLSVSKDQAHGRETTGWQTTRKPCAMSRPTRLHDTT